MLSGLSKTIATFRPIIAFEYSGHKHANWALIQEALSGYEFFEPVFRRGIAALFNGGMAELHPVGEGRKIVGTKALSRSHSTFDARSRRASRLIRRRRRCWCLLVRRNLRRASRAMRGRSPSPRAEQPYVPRSRGGDNNARWTPPLVPLSLGSLTITPNCLRDGELSTALWIKSTRDNNDCCPGLEQQVAHR